MDYYQIIFGIENQLEIFLVYETNVFCLCIYFFHSK